MRILLPIFFLCLVSCNETSNTDHVGFEFFPSIPKLEQGLVWKYYNHRIEKENAQTKTNIRYIKRVLKNDTFFVEQFNAAFQKNYKYKVVFESGKSLVYDEKYFNYWEDNDEAVTIYNESIKENTMNDWEGNDAVLDKALIIEDSGRRNISYQKDSKDSISGESKFKIFSGQRNYISIREGEYQDTTIIDWTKTYESGLGMIHSSSNFDDFSSEFVLDEIMTVSAFEKRANHGMHRVAYIDTLKTLDDHTLFTPCFHPTKINDYYNDDPSGFKGGKGRLRAVLKEKLDPLKLKGNSGYLTYRFVINCNGEAGWFVTEECNLDYSKKSFTEDCRMHIYDILKAEEHWRNLLIRNDAKDAYTYLTFKIENDEIVEILP